MSDFGFNMLLNTIIKCVFMICVAAAASKMQNPYMLIWLLATPLLGNRVQIVQTPDDEYDVDLEDDDDGR